MNQEALRTSVELPLARPRVQALTRQAKCLAGEEISELQVNDEQRPATRVADLVTAISWL
jgi:hypothetical protein